MAIDISSIHNQAHNKKMKKQTEIVYCQYLQAKYNGNGDYF